MARLFPFRSEPAQNEGQPRVVDLEGEDADAVFSALSSTTARRIYARLDEEPGTPSDVADAVDSSIQNVRYHLENLEDAGLVEVVDTWYSSRGNEMSVYGTTDGPLIVTSDESTASRLREALSRFVGGVVALAASGLLVQYAVTRWARSMTESAPAETTPGGSGGSDDGADADEPTVEYTDEDGGFEAQDSPGDAEAAGNESFEGEVTGAEGNGNGNETADYAADGGTELADAILDVAPPGLLFFLGGLLVLLAVTAYWYWYRPSY